MSAVTINPITLYNEKFSSDYPHPKFNRGWGSIYDVIFNDIGDKLNVVTEIGVGNATCQLAWARTFPGKQIVGIDIASPSLALCEDTDLQIKQFTNAMNGIYTLHSHTTMSELANIDIYYNKDAYTKDIAKQYLEIYGKQIFFINDGKQDGLVHRKFREIWDPLLLPGGLLLQERIGRRGTRGIRINQLVKAVDEGWLVYDCREYVKFEDPNCNGFLGIWTQERDYWGTILKDFKRVTDPKNQIEEKYQISDNDDILQ